MSEIVRRFSRRAFDAGEAASVFDAAEQLQCSVRDRNTWKPRGVAITISNARFVDEGALDAALKLIESAVASSRSI
jgi:hypothetical protein